MEVKIMTVSNQKLGTAALAALVVSAMIGGGIFSLPQNMAQSSGLTAVLIAWIITGAGMFFLSNSFRILSAARPDASAGIYMYARLGFGKFAGFQMAWAYYLSNVFGNVGYAVLLMDAFNYFFPGTFTGGNNLYSVIGGSFVIWLMCFLVLRGTHQAASINGIGTSAKLMPLALFILAGGVAYSIGIIPFAVKTRASHFIWHFFVLVGAFLQWVGNYFYLIK